MSRMSQISLEIQDRLAQEQDPREIARIMDIPVHWVYEVQEEEYKQEYAWTYDSSQI